MTDPAPNRISADLVLTGPADQLLAAKAAILRMELDFPGLKLEAKISTQVSTIEYVGRTPLEQTTIEEFLGHPRSPDDPDCGQIDRIRNCLRRRQIETMGELLEKREDDLLAITNFGQKSRDLLTSLLADHGLQLKS